MPCGCGKNVPQLSEEEIAARAERQRVAREQQLAIRARRNEEIQKQREVAAQLRLERRAAQLRAREERALRRQGGSTA